MHHILLSDLEHINTLNVMGIFHELDLLFVPCKEGGGSCSMLNVVNSQKPNQEVFSLKNRQKYTVCHSKKL